MYVTFYVTGNSQMVQSDTSTMPVSSLPRTYFTYCLMTGVYEAVTAIVACSVSY